MGNINGKFAEQNDIVTSGQIISANNNQISLNAAIAETNHLRATSAIFQPTGLLATVNNLVPNVTTTLTGTISAALAGQGQQGTASTEPGGGGIPCFFSDTLISLPDSQVFIPEITCGMTVLAFDESGKRVPKVVTDTQSHLVESYCELLFDDGTTTGVDADQQHRYWTYGDFVSVKELDKVWHWSNGWVQRRIIDRQLIQKTVILYNFTVADLHCYIANGDAVSNLKPADSGGGIIE